MKIAGFLAIFVALLISGLSSARAVEFPGAEIGTSPGDWAQDDRAAWKLASERLTVEELKAWVSANATNSFLKAAVANTKANRPNEYKTVRERNSYYDYLSILIETEAPGESKKIRFFHAATAVTIRAELGMIDAASVSSLESLLPSFMRRVGVTKSSLAFIRDVNVELFAKNMRVARDVLYTWTEPRDPRAISPTKGISAFDFDMAMVDFEQSTVQGFLNRKPVTDGDLRDVTRQLETNAKWSWLGIIAQVKPQMKKAGYSKIDFSDYRWRVALGRGLVFLFLQKNEAEYLDFMKANPPPMKGRPDLYSGLGAPKEAKRTSSGSFTILGSWKTERGAIRHAAELRQQHVGIEVAVYPPYGSDKYWTVVSSSFADAAVAKELSRKARRSRLASDAYVLKRAAVDHKGKTVLPSPKAAQLGDVPNYLRVATSEVAPEGQMKALSLFESSVQADVEARAKSLRALYPSLELGCSS